MIVDVECIKRMVSEADLSHTPYYSRSRGLKFLWYPVPGFGWREMFFIFDGKEIVGTAICFNEYFEIYVKDKKTADEFCSAVPIVWRDYIHGGTYEVSF